MKKAISLLLTLVLILSVFASASAAGIDLSAMSWDELIALREAISKEQMSRNEWQSVEVPAGVYKVGEDIPAGKWKLTNNHGTVVMIEYGSELNETKSGVKLTFGGVYDCETIYNPNGIFFSEGERTEWVLELSAGMYISFDSTVTFETFTGKAALGFK